MTDQPIASSAAAAGPEDLRPREWRRIVLATWKDAGEDNLGLVAAGVAFYAFLAFVPLLTAFVLSYGLFAEPASVVRHMQALTGMMPQDAARIIADQLRSMTQTNGAQTGLALVVAMGVAFYGASKGAASVVTALNIVFEISESRTFVRRTLLTLGMAVGAVILLLLAILAISALNFLEEVLPELGGVGEVLLKGLFLLLAAAVVILLLAILYRYGPNRPNAAWRWITPGSVLATIVWLAATAGFGVYVANFGDYNATYGSLGAVIVFLTWMYLTAYILLLGAELNAVLESEMDKRLAPAADASAPEAPTADALPLASLAMRLGMLSILLALLGGGRRATGHAPPA